MIETEVEKRLRAGHKRSCDHYEGGSCDCGFEAWLYERVELTATFDGLVSAVITPVAIAAQRPDETERERLDLAVRGRALVAGRLAQLFHETYERLAPSYGYTTREESAVPWADVPETNRALMTATVQSLIEAGHLAAPSGEREA